MADFTPDDGRALLRETFAPWVQMQGLDPMSFSKTQARFRLPPVEATALQGGPGKGLVCGQAIAAAAETETVLLDCATLWLTNLLLRHHDIGAEADHLIDTLRAAPCPVVVVSNEVGQGIVPENALARQFRVEQGRLNRRLAAEAGLVVAAMAGLPLLLKGDRPACL